MRERKPRKPPPNTLLNQREARKQTFRVVRGVPSTKKHFPPSLRTGQGYCFDRWSQIHVNKEQIVAKKKKTACIHVCAQRARAKRPRRNVRDWLPPRVVTRASLA